MNLESIIEYFRKAKEEAVEEFSSEELEYDEDTITSVEMSLAEIDQVIEILTAYADASADEEWSDWGDEN